jgi:hypothetical protein
VHYLISQLSFVHFRNILTYLFPGERVEKGVGKEKRSPRWVVAVLVSF